MILVMAFFLITYTFHSTWVTSEAYSSPSIVLSARGGDGSRIIFDDFREAYYWLRHNTPEVSEICLKNFPLLLIVNVFAYLTLFLCAYRMLKSCRGGIMGIK